MKTFTTLLFVLLPLGCTSVPLGYPDAWPPMRAVQSNACPDLAGTYKLVGETTPRCTAGEECAHLPYDLLDGIPELQDKVSLTGTRVELRQPAGALEITVRDGERESGGVSLSAARGDFRCTPNGLVLAPRNGRVFVVGGEAYREQRTFNRASDGGLVMLRESLGGNGLTLPFGEHARYWVRWPQDGH